ncbi:hypothetical protein GCM10020295_19560 [Streptomyces cinereospinus]
MARRHDGGVPHGGGSGPGRRTAAALDLPLRLLAATARTAALGAAQDLTDLLGEPTTQAGTDDAGHDTSAPKPGVDDTDAELPSLEAGFYLYEDITLGALAVLGPLLGDHAPTGWPMEPVTGRAGP